MIVTEAGVHPNVSALVYVAARAPDAGEDYTALAKTFPTPPASAGIVFDGDEGRLTEEAFLRDFAGDIPEAKAKVLYAVQEPFQKALLTGKTTQAAWRSKPSFYAVSTEDRTINPDLERFMAKRMGAKTIEVKSSHLSLISHPEEITNLILEAAGQRFDRRTAMDRQGQGTMKRFGSAAWSGNLREGKGCGLDREPRAGGLPLQLLQPLRRKAGHQSRGTARRRPRRVFHHVVRAHSRHERVRARAIGRALAGRDREGG